MCGIKSKVGFLLLALFFWQCSPLYSADVFQERVYTITESELLELEAILTTQRQTISELQSVLQRQARTIDELQSLHATQASRLTQLSISFDEYVSAERRNRLRLGVSVGAASFGVGIVTGLILGLLGG